MKKWMVAAAVIAVGAILGSLEVAVHAANVPTGNFDLQVTPSPLVETVKPGAKSTLQLKIRNAGTAPENLRIDPRSFRYDSTSGKVQLDDATLPQVAAWLTFAKQVFTIQPGQWYTENITVDIPRTAGFSYSFALQISRQKIVAAPSAGQAINGSVTVFTLINVDRPGAKSGLKAVSFTTDKKLYEYPPTTLTVRFDNTGNTILQPSGNIFIERASNSKNPMASLTVNSKQSYILPDTQRSFSASWNSGFATYQTSTDSSGKVSKHLVIDWQKFAQFRIGKYTASLVAVYNDNGRDVPITGTVTFWVVPWRAILALIALIATLVWFVRWRGKKRTEKAVKKALAAQAVAQKKAEAEKRNE